jgi:protein-S-isoprenylcysteine O-methyltransferase Ste14
MPVDDLFLRQAIVLATALIYWAGVMILARRVRKQIGRLPNVRPRGPKERLLWAGWILVVAAWMTLPFVVGRETANGLVRLIPVLLHPLGFVLGIALILAGYGATLWCYAIMGDTWRMGIDRGEKTNLVTRGPYGVVRHPIYLFQVIILAGVVLLLPAVLAVLIFFVHLLCVWCKAADEEDYLLTVHGQDYRDYLARTGRLMPRLSGRTPAAR